jgi:hypothetical protein
MKGRALPVVLLAAVLAGSCAKAQARSEPELPPLDVPPAPARVIAPLESEPLPAPVVAVDDTPAQPRRRPARPVRPDTRSGDAGRLEAPRPSDAPAEAARATETNGEEAPLLTVQPGRDGAFERAIRNTLGRASSDLGRVNYGVLGTEAKAQYDTAKRFIEQGHDALRAKNFVFAENLADKAAVLAAILVGQ